MLKRQNSIGFDVWCLLVAAYTYISHFVAQCLAQTFKQQKKNSDMFVKIFLAFDLQDI